MARMPLATGVIANEKTNINLAVPAAPGERAAAVNPGVLPDIA